MIHDIGRLTLDASLHHLRCDDLEVRLSIVRSGLRQLLWRADLSLDLHGKQISLSEKVKDRDPCFRFSSKYDDFLERLRG